MTKADLIAAVRAECGGRSQAWAEGALRSTLSAIAGALAEPARLRLADRLPRELRDAVSVTIVAADGRSIVALVAHAEALHATQAREQIQAVMRALGAQLDAGERQDLRDHLPADARDLVPEPRPYAAPAVAHVATERAHHHLSDGRPGSAHPLSEAQPTTPHAHSIAATSDPHADTKLSSGHVSVRTSRRGRPGG